MFLDTGWDEVSLHIAPRNYPESTGFKPLSFPAAGNKNVMDGKFVVITLWEIMVVLEIGHCLQAVTWLRWGPCSMIWRIWGEEVILLLNLGLGSASIHRTLISLGKKMWSGNQDHFTLYVWSCYQGCTSPYHRDPWLGCYHQDMRFTFWFASALIGSRIFWRWYVFMRD